MREQVKPDIKGHEWVTKKFIRRTLICCQKCGIVQRSDGMNSQCKGQVHVELRDVNDAQSDLTKRK